MIFQFHNSKSNRLVVLDIHVWWHFLLPVICVALLIVVCSVTVENDSFGSDSSLGQHMSGNSTHADLSKVRKRLAYLEGETARLEAFAERMIQLAKLDKTVFSFNKPPGRGGVALSAGNGRNPVSELSDLNREVQALETHLLHQSHQLERMQLVLKSRVLNETGHFAHWPVQKGYVSSKFGRRKDPFSGLSRYHGGLDIAAPKGTAVMSIAAGKVVFSGRKGGYGRVVELEHADGAMSRYAHLSTSEVKLGQHVARGQLIAKVGSTGRSTGPHLHLEVIKHNRRINPELFLSGRSFLY